MLAEKVQHFIEGRSLAKLEDRILIAYSGGPDSTCLLHIIQKRWRQCAAIYVNHNLRGKESDREEAFVRSFCAQRNIPLFVERISWKQRPSNLEEAARKRRYRHFAAVAAEHKFDKVALAHQKDDVAETVLLRLLRGSGPAGLASIPAKRGIYIRPLLECSRDEILHYLEAHDLPYFSDTTNASVDFRRNRLRNELIPYLQQHFNPAVLDALWRSSRWLHEQNELVRELLQPYEHCIGQTKDAVVIDREQWAQLSVPLRKAILRLAMNRADPSLHLQARTMSGLLKAIAENKTIQLPGHLQADVTSDKIVFIRKSFPGPSEIDVPHDGSFLFLPANKTLIFKTIDRSPIAADRNLAFVDAEKAAYPLYIRNARRGDSFHPLGMSGHKKLSDFFIDRKIPRSERKRIPLVLKDDEIVWVAGLQLDNNYRITENTRRILRIQIEDNV